MHFHSILSLASIAATFVAAIPSPLSVDSPNPLEKRQASKFCTTLTFTNPYCGVPQVDVANIVFAASSCVEVPGGATVATIQEFGSICYALNKIPLCCNLVVNGFATCSEAVQH
ncbi:hypothetical protein MFRU_008g03050 [Monilinia fructicola]|nr:hypothetical protein MFRU_008g03050 [Monilinia fructicola]